MVLDKNLGLHALADLIDTGGSVIDLVKFGWGTSVIQEESLIREKCSILSAHNILCCPGGTLTELVWLQGKLDSYLKRAQFLGFSCIEVSNGTVPIPESSKTDIIKKALDMGFCVTSEVGSKLPEEDKRISLESRLHQIQSDLEAGAWKVIIESRESGMQGIFDEKGGTQLEYLHALTNVVGAHNLIFEAPKRSQQAELILTLGNDVNLGNIAPFDVVPLETLRMGLRSDTLRPYHMNYPCIRIGLGADSALAASKLGDVVVVVDALRASSTIVTALAHGMRCVRPVASVEACVGEVTAGERGGKKIEQLQFDNSPISFANSAMAGKELVLTTSNGTECLLAAGSNPQAITLVGSLLNAGAAASSAMDLARKHRRNISIICAGRNNQMASEDLIAASEIIMSLPGAPVLGELQPVSSSDFYRDFLASESGLNLSALGKTDDVLFCAKKDNFPITPIYSQGIITILV
jgi:phosphosulfolactate synthase (CoM biosynthesis protein A)/phosphosulfolactate phosphohydrolase-like enzyme